MTAHGSKARSGSAIIYTLLIVILRVAKQCERTAACALLMLEALYLGLVALTDLLNAILNDVVLPNSRH